MSGGVGRDDNMLMICNTATVLMIVILLKRVGLLADQLSKIPLIFSIKLELRDLSSITISLGTHLILCKRRVRD